MKPVEVREPIGVVIALPLECRSLGATRAKRLDTLQPHPNCWITVSGAGPVNAAAAAEKLVERGARRLVSWGCAGALAEHLAPGDVIIAQSIRSADGKIGNLAAAWRQRLLLRLNGQVPCDEGVLTESETVVASPDAKRNLRETSGAVAVDMESAAVLRIAERHQLPFLAVRAIADTAVMALPAIVLNALDEHGEVRLPTLLLELARRPSELRPLLHLNRCFRRAIQSLERVAALSGPSLTA